MKTPMPIASLSIFLLLLITASCSVYEQVPNVKFRGPTLRGVQTDLDAGQLRLDLGLRFLFTNPLKKAIIVPQHTFTIKLNGDALSSNLQTQPSFQVKAESEQLITYTYSFDLSPGGVLSAMDVLGRDNYYEFEAQVDIDLKDFGLKVPTALGKIPLRKHTLTFNFGDTIRLPLLPVVEPAGIPAAIRFVGQMESFDLAPVRNAMAPLVDLLLDAEFDASTMDPFVQLLLSAEVDIYSPTPTQPFRTMRVNLGDHIVQTLLLPLYPDAPGQWEDFKEKMNPGQVNVMNHLVATFLNPFDQQASQHWQQFKAQWSGFKESPLTFQYPGPRVTGMQVEVPLRIYNPNAFPVRAPNFSASARENSYQPLVIQASPASGPPVIPAGARQPLTVLVTLDWRQAGQGILGLMQGTSFQPRLTGATSVDLGYGLMEMKIDIPLTLQAGTEGN